jgi:septal ring factor EnvC (AmiA/AmiB activator)
MLSLVDKGWVLKKDFPSKSTTKVLYWANQGCANKDLWNSLHFATAEECQESRKSLAALQQQQRSIEQELVEVLREPSNEELTLQCQTTESELVEMKERRDAMKKRIADASSSSNNNNNNTSRLQQRLGFMKKAQQQQQQHAAKPKSPTRLKKQINGMRDEWRDRKRKCMDFVETFADGMDKRVKDVVKLLDLETDERADATMPPKYDV